MWLRGLAEDVLEHEGCDGCKQNAAQALEHLGVLAEVLAAHDIPDPRTSPAGGDGNKDISSAYTSNLTVSWGEPPQT